MRRRPPVRGQGRLAATQGARRRLRRRDDASTCAYAKSKSCSSCGGPNSSSSAFGATLNVVPVPAPSRGGHTGEEDVAVDTLVRALLRARGGASADEAECPRLKLELVLRGQLPRAGQIDRLVDDVVVLAGYEPAGVGEAVLDEADGEVRHVDPDPLPAELLCGGDGCTAAAEGLEDDATGIATGLHGSGRAGPPASASGSPAAHVRGCASAGCQSTRPGGAPPGCSSAYLLNIGIPPVFWGQWIFRRRPSRRARSAATPSVVLRGHVECGATAFPVSPLRVPAPVRSERRHRRQSGSRCVSK
jgi:hypothetical protein